jgi:hypothetical protein
MQGNHLLALTGINMPPISYKRKSISAQNYSMTLQTNTAVLGPSGTWQMNPNRKKWEHGFFILEMKFLPYD